MSRYPMQRLDDIEAAMEAIREHLARGDLTEPMATAVPCAAQRCAEPATPDDTTDPWGWTCPEHALAETV